MNIFLRSVSSTVLLGLALSSIAMAQQRPGPPPPPNGSFPGMPGAGSTSGANPAAQTPHPGTAPHHDAQRPGASSVANSQAARAGVQFGPVGRWWDDRSVVRSVGLSSDQQRRMDTIFNSSKPAILASYQSYLKEQAKLNLLSRDPQASQASTFAAIDSVNQARAALQKATAQMYMQIRQQMNPDQIQKLEKLE